MDRGIDIFRNGMELGKQLLLLLGFFLGGLFLVSLLSSLLVNIFGNTVTTAYGQSALQCLLAFMLPAWLSGRLQSSHAFELLGMDSGYSLKALIALIVVFAVGLPALNQIIYWNANLHLPSGWEAIEQGWREMEEQNTAYTSRLTSGKGVLSLISGIGIVGLLTGLSEEMFFRGALQKMFVRYGVNRHVAVWTAAFIFSLMHFQMFGFVPRLLLGAWFGYLLLWSGSLWLSATAHAINNTLVVVCIWLNNRDMISGDFDMFGVSVDTFPTIACLSAVLTTLLIIYVRKWFQSSSKRIISGNLKHEDF